MVNCQTFPRKQGASLNENNPSDWRPNALLWFHAFKITTLLISDTESVHSEIRQSPAGFVFLLTRSAAEAHARGAWAGVLVCCGARAGARVPLTLSPRDR